MYFASGFSSSGPVKRHDNIRTGFPWRRRQSKRFPPLSSWVWFSLWTRVKRVSQRSAESRGFSPGAPVSSYKASWQGGLG